MLDFEQQKLGLVFFLLRFRGYFSPGTFLGQLLIKGKIPFQSYPDKGGFGDAAAICLPGKFVVEGIGDHDLNLPCFIHLRFPSEL